MEKKPQNNGEETGSGCGYCLINKTKYRRATVHVAVAYWGTQVDGLSFITSPIAVKLPRQGRDAAVTSPDGCLKDCVNQSALRP